MSFLVQNWRASGTGRRSAFGGDEPWGLEKSSNTDCSDTLTLEKSSLCLLRAETDMRQEPRTTTQVRTSEVRDVSTHIRFNSLLSASRSTAARIEFIASFQTI